MSAQPIETHPSLVRQAMRAVTDHIRTQQLRVGDTLPGEAHFASQLGVSRAVMREAFGALSALHLLEVANGRKARVGALDGSVLAASLSHGVTTAQITVADVWDVRRTIEARTVYLAAQNRTEGEAREILQLAAAMAEATDIEEVTRHDVALHQAIARAGRNALFTQIVSSFGPLMEVAVPAAWRTRTTEADKAAVIGNHLALAQAIADSDGDRAVAVIQEHFHASIGDVFAAMSEARSGRDN